MYSLKVSSKLINIFVKVFCGDAYMVCTYYIDWNWRLDSVCLIYIIKSPNIVSLFT